MTFAREYNTTALLGATTLNKSNDLQITSQIRLNYVSSLVDAY